MVSESCQALTSQSQDPAGSWFSITVLECEFSNQALGDGFREGKPGGTGVSSQVRCFFLRYYRDPFTRRAIVAVRPSTASANRIDMSRKAHGMRLPCPFAHGAGEVSIQADTVERWFLSVLISLPYLLRLGKGSAARYTVISNRLLTTGYHRRLARVQGGKGPRAIPAENERGRGLPRPLVVVIGSSFPENEIGARVGTPRAHLLTWRMTSDNSVLPPSP
jgi:hypothetical protein